MSQRSERPTTEKDRSTMTEKPQVDRWRMRPPTAWWPP
jgi:hypothetical protein